MSDLREDAGLPAIRLVFQLDRAENPRLYDDLVRFHKGARRVNRLRLLAHEGLRVQQGETGWMVHGIGGGNQPVPEPEGVITNGIFEPGIP